MEVLGPLAALGLAPASQHDIFSAKKAADGSSKSTPHRMHSCGAAARARGQN
jgi:hypothetical protein